MTSETFSIFDEFPFPATPSLKRLAFPRGLNRSVTACFLRTALQHLTRLQCISMNLYLEDFPTLPSLHTLELFGFHMKIPLPAICARCPRLRELAHNHSLFAWHFHDLVEDVVLRILALCEIYPVVSLGQTNKYFHHISLQKSVWFVLLVDLRARGFLHHTSISDLRALSAQELIGLAKHLQIGPATWLPPPPSLIPEPPKKAGSQLRSSVRRWIGKSGNLPVPEFPSPQVSKQLVLYPSIPYLDSEKEAKVLRGGQYVLFKVLACLRVVDTALIWTHQSTIPNLSVSAFEFAAETDEDDGTVKIFIGERIQKLNGVRTTSSTWTSGREHSKQSTPLPLTRPFRENPFFNFRLCGDFATVGLYQDFVFECMVINWRRNISFRLTSSNPLLVEIIPGYLIFTTRAVAGEQVVGQDLCVSTLDSLEKYWAGPTGAASDHPISVKDLDTVISERTSLKNPTSALLNVHESVVQRGTYRFWLYLSNQKRATLQSYRLALEGGGLNWRYGTFHDAEPNMISATISHSGHRAVRMDGDRVRIIPPSREDKHLMIDLPGVDLPEAGERVELSAYNETLSYTTSSSVVVLYFR
ncbi:hypothetical protein DFH09DRAFT_1504247 [Mycena vulgaris]|nr:hypothetical protein DFH09DRAFT_1504247 [Mycena vulgaris]